MQSKELTAVELPAAATGIFTRERCEAFIAEETALLDAWELDAWFALFTQDAIYEVPMAGLPDSDSATTLFYLADDYARLRHRVERLKKKTAHAEWPRSVGLRMTSNIRVLKAADAGVHVECKFVTYRTKNEVTDTYFGTHKYVLREIEGEIKIAHKRTILALNTLRPQGKISIFL